MKGIDLIAAWVKHAGLDNDNLEGNGRICNLILKETVPVSVEAPEYSDDLFIVIDLMEAGKGELRRKRLEFAMRMNVYALETRGGVTGWDHTSNRLILTYRTNAETTSVKMLDNMIANLVEVADNILPGLLMKPEQEKAEIMESRFDSLFRPYT